MRARQRQTKIAAAIVLSVGILWLAGWASADGNDPDSFNIHFKNDLDQPVFLALCKSAHSAKSTYPGHAQQIDLNTTPSWSNPCADSTAAAVRW